MDISVQNEFILNALSKNDGVIAFPTDTVWGLGCKISSSTAVKKIYEIKSREDSKPLIILGSSKQALKPYVKNWTPKIDKIISKYMPGSLTLVVEKSDLVPDFVTCGFNTIGIRIPNSEILLSLLDNIPENALATTSANISGEPACLSYEEVNSRLGDVLDYIVKYTETAPSGTASTVASIDKNGNIKILRQGETIIDEDLL